MINEKKFKVEKDINIYSTSNSNNVVNNNETITLEVKDDDSSNEIYDDVEYIGKLKSSNNYHDELEREDRFLERLSLVTQIFDLKKNEVTRLRDC